MFLEYEYLIYSERFVQKPYYIVNALLTNYLHLTGVNTTLSTYEFFNKSLSGDLADCDFDFIKKDKNNKLINVKGSVRQKVKALELMSLFFSQKLVAEEAFAQKSIACSLATSDNKITMGFVDDDTDAKPKTLLWGNELNKTKIVDVALILRRSRNADRFDTIIYSDINNFHKLFPNLVTEALHLQNN